MNDNVIPLPHGNAAARRAQEWVVRVDAGRLSAQERQELQAWLAEDPGHAKLLDTHALLWVESSRATFPPMATGSVQTAPPKGRFLPAGSQAPAWERLNRPTAWGLAGLLLLGLGWMLWGAPTRRLVEPPSIAQAMQVSLSTGVGQRLERPLVDGSRVQLNTASTIQVAYSKERRRVVLGRGEVLFDVAKDARRPFEVVAGTTTVRAIGTRFSVYRMPDDRIEVTVFEGVVEIVKEKSRATDQPLRLGIGQAIATQADKVVLQQLAKPALEHKLAWLEDRLVFDRLSLGEAVTQVNRYSALPLRVVDPELTGVLLSGAFSTSEIPVFINSLEQGFGLHVERTAGAYLISKASAR